MSRQRVEHASHSQSRLGGPFFPFQLEALHDLVYADGEVAASGLSAAFSGIDGFNLDKSMASTFVTDDRYQWYFTAWFLWNGCGFVVAFPWAKDTTRTDGSPSDRSMAVYTTFDGDGEFNPTIMETLYAMIEALQKKPAAKDAA